MNSKNTVIRISAAILCSMMLILCAVSCAEEIPELWQGATYTEDKTFGEGATAVQVEVVAGDKSVTFTIKTDKTTLGDALLEHSLVEGEAGAFGLYIKSVNGIRADYDLDGAYWQFTKGGEYMMTGVDGTSIADGEQSVLVWTKG